jgi:hypothetical protein
MTFSFRHLLRQAPSNATKAFFDSRGAEFGDAVDWRAAEHVVARQIAEAMDRMSGDDVAPLISGLERAYALSDEHGIRAHLACWQVGRLCPLTPQTELKWRAYGA